MRSYTRSRLVSGWGVNDADYNTHIQISKGKYKVCPYYVKWRSMLERVFNTDLHSRQPTYKDVMVDESWKFFRVFREWCVSQPSFIDVELDKDILVIGNKKYGPSTCCLVPKWLNNFMSLGNSDSKFPLGVSYKKTSKNATKVYYVQVGKIDRSNMWVGSSYTPEEAHGLYQLAKAEQMEKAILKYMLDPSYRQDVANAIYLRAEMLRDDHANHRETFSL